MVSEQTNKQKESDVVENNYRDNSESLDEHYLSYQISKEEIAKYSVETTEIFSNAQQIKNTETASIKHSI